MAVTPKPPPRNHHLQPPSTIPINMSSLTHSELLSLSLLSSSSSSSSSSSCTPPSNDVISTSQFLINPSLSTHQQTYSPSPHTHHRRLQHHDPLESNLIISFLKKQLHFRNGTIVNGNNNDGDVVDIVNKDGVVVDLAALEERDRHGGLFVEELRKMANGNSNEDELLQMLADIQGDWCSRRKKARVVDASVLGDALPLGWKLIVALRRKAGRFSPYCRRYISPTGERFSSCKEISSYLQSYFGINDAKLVRDSRVECQPLQDSVNRVSLSSERDNSMLNSSNATMRNTCAPIEHEKDASILGIDNLPDVQVCDLYECLSCNISFDEKDKYLQHMFALHQKTTKRYTLDSSVGDKVLIKDGKTECPKRKRRRKHGSSVADGVIIKNGKYGCQFCDKVFEERRRYLGHVGNHVKGSIKTPAGSLFQVNGSAKSPCMDKSSTVISNSRMDALIEIAQSSMQDVCAPLFEKDPSSANNVDRLRAAGNTQVVDADRNTKENSSSCLTVADMDKPCRDGKTFSAELYPYEMLSKISGARANETAREGLEEGKTPSEELHPPYRVIATSLSDAVNHLDSLTGEHEGEGIDEDKSLSSALNPQGIMGEIPRTDENNLVSTSYPDECELEKNVKEGKTLLTKRSPIAKMSKSSFSEMSPHGKVGKIPRTDEISVTTSCPDKCEFNQNAGEGKTLSTKMNPLAKMSNCPSSELNSQGKSRKILSTDENIDVATSCLNNQCEIKKDVKEGEALSTELDPLAKTSKMSTTDEERKGQYFSCNTVDYEKYSYFETSMTSDAECGISDNVIGNGSCKSIVAEESTDKPVGADDIHYLLCEDKASDPISSGEKIKLEQVHNFEFQHKQKYYDSEPVPVSSKNHASSCTVLQSSLNSSSTFDEIFEKQAGQDICSLDQNLYSESGAEYMKLDVIEPQMYKYNGMNQEDSISFYEVSMDLENNIGLGLKLDSSPKAQSEFPHEMSGKCLTMTVCVWCGVEFSHEIVDVEPQPDSVGFMCPACRAKISKQFNELESNFSLSSQC